VVEEGGLEPDLCGRDFVANPRAVEYAPALRDSLASSRF